VIYLTEEIQRLINDIDGILNNPSYVPKTMLEVQKNHEIVECLIKAQAGLRSAISDEPTDIAVEYQNEDKAIEIMYD